MGFYKMNRNKYNKANGKFRTTDRGVTELACFHKFYELLDFFSYDNKTHIGEVKQEEVEQFQRVLGSYLQHKEIEKHEYHYLTRLMKRIERVDKEKYIVLFVID